MSLMDILTRNILHHMNSRIFVISAYASLTAEGLSEKFAESIYYLIGSTLFPLALGLSLPLFMYTVVLERQNRLKGIMLMHGLLDTHYWLVNLFSSFLLYMCIYFTFYAVGRYIFGMAIFIETGTGLFVFYSAYLAPDKLALGS